MTKCVLSEQYVNTLLKETISKHGYLLQQVVAAEECAELIQAISKSIRGFNNRENLIEEIVDVEIMLKQLIIINNISEEELNKWKLQKIERIAKRLAEEKQ